MSRPSSSGFWKWLVGGSVVLFVSCGVVGYRLWAIYSDVRDTLAPTPAHMTFEADITRGQLEFHMTYDKAADGVSDLTVLDEADNVLWRLSGRGIGHAPMIRYGQVPLEKGVEWKQSIPEDGRLPKDIRGMRVRAFLTCDYLGPLSKGSQTAKLTIDVPK